MSHFVTVICLPGDTELAGLEKVIGAVMDRWDESREVPRYRSYETGSPDEFWFARSLRDDAQRHGSATYEAELEKARRNAKTWDRVSPEEVAAKELADVEAAYRWVGKFGPGPWSWTQVVEAYNATFHPADQVATVDDDGDDGGRMHVDDGGRAYTWSTSNPEGKWDYWRIGGRWRNYFIAAEAGTGLVRSAAAWDSPAEDGGVLDRLRVDGGPVGMLNLDLMRDEWASKQLVRFDRWQQIVAEHGQPPAWADLVGLAELGETTIQDARRRYQGHPAIRAARAEDIAGWDEGPEVEFGTTREEFERLARLDAVPGFALVTLDGQWMAPGEMGWFGTSSDGPGEREAYKIEANRYLEGLDPSTIVVALDLHV